MKYMRLAELIIGGSLSLVASLASAQECYESSILNPTPFMGNNGEIFQLADGSVWEVKYEYEYLYEYYPNVIACPAQGKMAVAGKTLNVEQVAHGNASTIATPAASIIESQIEGEFEGWEGETIVKLLNGQIWQQSDYYYYYHYAFMPQVIIFRSDGGHKMKVEGIEKSVGVRRLK